MKIFLNGVFAEIVEASDLETESVKKALTFPVSSMRLKYTPNKGRHISWDEDAKCFLFDDRYFPSTFLELLPANLDVKFSSTPQKELQINLNFKTLPFTLKPFQAQAVKKILQHEAALVVGPTSIGKTFLIGTLVNVFHGNKILILCHNKGLANQNLERLREWFPKFHFGKIFGGVKEFDAPIAVATFQSLRGLPYEADVVLIDECVHTLAPSYLQTLIHSKAQRWYGFTATPKGRSDKLDSKLQVLFGDRVNVGDFDLGRKEGLLCPVDFYILKYNPPEFRIPGWRLQDSNWIYQNFVAQDAERNKLIQFLATFELERTGKVVLVLVHRLTHLEILRKMLPNCLALSYKSKLREREKARKLKSGILVSTRVIEEGIDNHSIYSIINAACVRSQIAIIQRLGRGLRFEEGKRLAFFDIWDQSPPVLKSQGQSRISLYKDFGDVEILNTT